MTKQAREYLTTDQRNFLLELAEEGVRVTGCEVVVVCAETGEKEYPGIGDEYLDICGNLEHFWVCFGDARFYIIVQSGPVMQLIADYYTSDDAEAIYERLDKNNPE